MEERRPRVDFIFVFFKAFPFTHTRFNMVFIKEVYQNMLTNPFHNLSFVCLIFSLFYFGQIIPSSIEISLKSQEFRVGRDRVASLSQREGSFDIRGILARPMRKTPRGSNQLMATDHVLFVNRYYYINMIRNKMTLNLILLQRLIKLIFPLTCWKYLVIQVIKEDIQFKI